MSLNSRQFSLYGTSLAPYVAEQSLALPPHLTGPYLNARPDRRSYLAEDGEVAEFHFIEYPERVLIDKRWVGKGIYSTIYTYSETPQVYPSYDLPDQKPVYQIFDEAQIHTLDDWVNFPFKADFTVSSEPQWDNGEESPLENKPLDILRHFEQQQKALHKAIMYFFNDGGRETVADKLAYLAELERKIPHQGDSITLFEDGEGDEVFYLENWRGLIFYELERAIKERARVNICQFCGRPIYLKPQDKASREFHNRDEDRDCTMAKDAADHKTHRLFKKTKPSE